MLPAPLACLLLLLIPESNVAQKLQPPSFPSRFFQEVLSPKANQKSCRVSSVRQGFLVWLQLMVSEQPTGMIEDACCDFETIEDVNEDLSRQLSSLVKSRYFRYWKVDLFRECPFWKEDGSCMNRACAVEEVDESSIPERWRMQRLSEVEPLNSSDGSNLDKDEDTCYFRESDFCQVEDLQTSEHSSPFYVDLPNNPERFTGYAGPSANKVWRAIYDENCFGTASPFQDPARALESGGSGFAHLTGGKKQSLKRDSLSHFLKDIQGPMDGGETEQCLEKRVYYRLISGLHASISIHICDEYLDQQTGEWSPNLDCFISRIGEHPERLQNVYFDYVVFLRALAKAGPYLEKYDMCTGNDAEDAKTKKEMKMLLSRAESCHNTFDESGMFAGQDSVKLKDEFKHHFRNVSRIMDCVGCDKCRLWGGLQVAGLGTAMKILFEEPTCGRKCKPDLTRSEVVAFINTLHRLSESLAAIERFRKLWSEREEMPRSADDTSPIAKPAQESFVASPVSHAPAVTTSLRTAEDAPAQFQEKQTRSPSELPSYHKSKQVPPPRHKTKRGPFVFPKQDLAPNVFENRHNEGPQLDLDPAIAWFTDLLRACQRSVRGCLSEMTRALRMSSSTNRDHSPKIEL